MPQSIIRCCDVCGCADLAALAPAASICRCNSCGFVFVNPQPSQADIQKYYSREHQYDQWLHELSARDLLWKRRLKKMQPFIRPGTLLDVGAGIGQFLAFSKPRFTQVYGTEISSTAAQIATQRFNVDIHVGDLLDINMKECAPFDNITLFHTLEHVPSPRTLLEQCHHLLSTSGILTIAVPNEIDSIIARLRRNVRRCMGALHTHSSFVPGTMGFPQLLFDGSVSEIHLSYFTVPVLVRLVEECHFKIIDLSLDPYYAKSGVKLFLHQSYYILNSVFFRSTGKNLYETIWITAQKI